MWARVKISYGNCVLPSGISQLNKLIMLKTEHSLLQGLHYPPGWPLIAYLRNEAPSQYLCSILRAQNEDLEAREEPHSVSCAVPLRHCQAHHSYRQENYMKTVSMSLLFLHKIHLTVFLGGGGGGK